MVSFNLVRWLRALRRSRGKTIEKTPRIRLRLEELESRLAPATFIWTGASGVNANWSTNANWLGGAAPTAAATASDPADLIFDSRGAGSLTPIDNISNLTVNSIQLSFNGYNLQMLAGTQPIKLGNAASPFTAITVGAGLTNEQIGLDMAFSAPAGTQQFFTIGSGSTLTAYGKLTGASGSQLTKLQTGTLILTADNGGFSGPVNLEADSGIVRIGHSKALGTGQVTVGNNSQLQLDPTAGNLTVGNSLSLFGPGVSNRGSIQNLTGDNIWTGPVAMGTNTSFNADSNSSLKFTGTISDLGSPFNVSKIGQGTVIFSAANTYRGTTTVTDGILTIQHGLALGAEPAAGTTVNRNSLLGTIGTLRLEYDATLAPTGADSTGNWRLQNPALPFNAATNPYVGFVVLGVPLTLNATGFGGNGALNNLEGNNAWTGTITLGSVISGFAPTIQVETSAITSEDTRLFLTGVIGDRASNPPFDLTKEGTGDLVLEPTNAFGVGTANLYHGATFIQEGTLTLRDSQGLGPKTKRHPNPLTPLAPIATVANDATLSLESNVGHIDSVTGNINRLHVAAPVSIIGVGYKAVGALRSLSGINLYTTDFPQSPLLDPITTVATPVGTLTVGQTYYYVVTAFDGYGESLSSNERAVTIVSDRTAHLTWAAVPGAVTYRIYRSLTPGTYTNPRVGIVNASGAPSFDDTNFATTAFSPPTVRPIIQMAGSASIGVETEPAQTPTADYFTNDYSLTIEGGIAGAVAQILTKEGTGHLILPNANNSLLGDSVIDSGWITIQHPDALGPSLVTVQNGQRNVTVNNTAALMLRPIEAGTNMTFNHNLNLQGVGITHPFALINQKGAVENLAGINTLDSNIDLTGKVGVGVEDVFGPSHLYLTGSMSEQAVTAINVDGDARGDGRENANPIDTGSLTGGTIIITADVLGVPDDIRVYVGDFVNSPGTAINVYDSTTNGDFSNPTNRRRAVVTIVYNSTTATATAVQSTGTGWNLGPVVTSYAALPNTFITIVVNEGSTSGSGTRWSYTAQILPNSSNIGGQLIKLGSQRLDVQGSGVYTGGVDIREGVVRVENHAALGTPSSNAGTTVQPGAALELAPTVTDQNGGLAVGESIWANHLTLNGSGNSEFGLAPVTVLSNDVQWTGPVTLNSTIDVLFRNGLANQVLPTMTANGSNLVGGGNVSVVTATPGGNGRNADQAILFTGTITGGSFTLTYDGTPTANISWSANLNTLIANIRTALNPVLGSANFGMASVSPTVDVRPNARMVISGNIDDGAGTHPADIHMAGGGDLVLAGTNTYRGTTFVHQGSLTLASGEALGATVVTGKQELALSGAVAGNTQFKLSFGSGAGSQTTTITYTGTAADATTIQAELNALTTIGPGGNVTVVQSNPGVFLITFGGSLAGNSTQLITVQKVSGTAGSAVVGFQGSTVVADNAQIQLQGGIAVAGEPLIIQGDGTSLLTEVQSFTVGATDILGSGTFRLQFGADLTNPIPFNATAIDVQNELQALPSVQAAAGLVQVSVAGIEDGVNETQEILFSNFAPGDRYQLYFDPSGGAAEPGINLTAALTYSVDPFTNLARITTALRALRTVSDLGVNGAIVPDSAGRRSASSDFARFRFEGAFANQGVPQVTFIPITGTGTPLVSEVATARPGSRTYTVVFQGGFAQSNVPALSAGATTGIATLSKFQTLLEGARHKSSPIQWFNQGPTPITNAEVFNNGGGGPQATTGRVTGVAVMQTFADDIFVSTAGGGYWKTVEGGRHWTPMFESVGNGVVFGGAVAVYDNANDVIPPLTYFAGGEANNNNGTSDSFYGAGIYLNGMLLVNNSDGANPLKGKAVSKIVINPNNPLMIWAAVSDQATNGTSTGAGIWRYDGLEWLNTTLGTFPDTDRVYSDVAYDDIQDVLYAAIGTVIPGSTDNDILYNTDPTAPTPGAWLDEAIEGVIGVAINRVGNIKLAVSEADHVFAAVSDAVTGGLLGILETTTGPGGWTLVNDTGGMADYLSNTGFYASAIVASGDNVYVGGRDQGSGTDFVLESTDAGANFADLVAGANTGPHTAVHGLALDSTGNLVVGTDGGVWRYDFVAATWSNLNGNLGITQMNAVSARPGNSDIILGGTQSNSAAFFAGNQGWNQVNPNTAAPTANVTRTAFVPGSPANVYAIVNGTLYRSSDSGATWAASGTARDIAVDLLNSARLLIARGNQVFESNNFGQTSIPLTVPPFGAQLVAVAGAAYQGNFVADPFFSSVVDIGANTYVQDTIYAASATNLFVTKNHGVLWTGTTVATSVRTPPMPANTTIRGIVVDSSDSNIVYVLANERVSVTDVNVPHVFVSRNAGQSWIDLTAGLPNLPVWKLAIDPRTNDLYLGTDSGVYQTTISFATATPIITGWQKFGAGLPNVQVKDIEVDTSTNTLTAGTYGRGVWQFYLNDNTLPTALPNPGALRATGGNNSWSGPIILAGATTISANGNQALQNGLSAASLTILGSISDATATNVNTLTKIGGGDVVLAGINTYAGVTDIREGNLDVQKSRALGGATIVGVQALSLVTPTSPTLTTLTPIDAAGNFAAGQTYYYVITALNANGESIASNELTVTTTLLNQAIEIRWDPVAGATGYNIYRSGTAGVFLSPARLITIPLGATSTYLDDGSVLLGNFVPPVFEFTLQFGTGAGSQTGTLTYTGASADAAAIESELNGLTTIGGVGGSVTVVRTNPGMFLITFGGSLAATMQPILPAVTSQPGSASVTPAGGTIVQNGAALELESDLDLEPITLNGNGIAPNYGGHYTGALRNLTGANIYTGTVTLNTNATIGAESGSTLMFARDPANPNPYGITDNGVGFSIDKEGAGKLVLQTVDSYGSVTAGTTVNQGILNIQNSDALGFAGATTTVRDGAQLQLEQSTVNQPTQLNPTAATGGTLVVGTTYFYVVTALTPAGESLVSNERSIVPSAGNQKADLSWNAVAAATGYRIYRSTTSGIYNNSLLTTIGSGATTSFTDTGAAVGAGTPTGLNIDDQNLVLSGSGIAGSGALLNVLANNTWGSASTSVSVTSVPGFGPNTTPAGTVAFGVTRPSDTMTIGSPISEPTSGAATPTTGPLPTGLTKVGAGRLTLTQDNTYSGTTYVNAGILAIQADNSLGTSLTDEIQRITVFDTLGTDTFRLTFKGQTTPSLTFGAGLLFSDVENALNALSTIGGVGGNVTVTRSTITVATPTTPQVGYIYTVTFHVMPEPGQPLITATPTGGINISVNRVADGGIGAWVKAGAALELDGDPLGGGGGIVVPSTENLLLGGTTGVNGAGGLRNVTGDNTWQAPVTLQTSLGITTDTIGVDAGSELTITGEIHDPTPNPIPSPIPPASLTKVGPGTLVFPNNNTYTGSTFINGGALNIRDTESLGVNTSAVQKIDINGTSGTFTLTFLGQTTGNLNVGIPASGGVGPTASMQNALNALSTINTGGGAVVVTQLGNVYSVFFKDPPLARKAQPLIVATPAAGFFTTITVLPAILGGESANVVASGASLQLESTTSLTESSGKALFLNGQGVNNTGALDSIAGSNQINPTTPITLQSDASFGAETAALLTVTQALTDRTQTQTITFPFTSGNSYTLKFDGLTTGILSLSATAATNVTTITNALNGLANIQLLGGAPVTVASVSGSVYTVTFGGRMVGTNWPAIVGTRVSDGSTFTATRVMNSLGFGINKYGPGIVDYAGTSANVYTGLTHVIEGTLELSKPNNVNAIAGDLTIGTPGIAEVQTVTITGTAGSFALTFNGQTTGNLAFNVPASGGASATASVQNALNALASIGGVGGSVSATKTGNIYTITFGGTLLGADLPLLGISGSAAGSTAPSIDGSRFSPPNSAAVELSNINQIVNTSNVLVNGDGLLNLNSNTEAFGTTLRIVDGEVRTGDASLILLSGLNMTGGLIVDTHSASPGGVDIQTGAITATSTATGPAVIQGSGNVNLHNATRTLTVNDGPNNSDFVIMSEIADLSGNTTTGITKTGTGRLELGADNTYQGNTTITTGDVQVDSVETVTLSGFSAGNQFTLALNGTATVFITYTGVSATDAAAIEAALNTLLASLGASGAATVEVIATDTFRVLFGGTLAERDIEPLVGAGPGTITVARVTTVDNIRLNGTGASGASLSGTGTIGSITMQTGSATGTINPGDNGPPAGVGILDTTGDVTLNRNSTFFVDLKNTNPGSAPVPGIDHDQLSVNGNVILGSGAGTGAQNALLTGSPGPGIQILDQFTIVQATGTITGLFDGIIEGVRNPIVDGGTVFLNGQKFTVSYFTQSVVLTRQLAVFTSFTMTADNNPSVYGQEVTYTVTADPEPGASLVTANPVVTFNLDGVLYTQTVAMNQTTGVATFTPQAHFGLVWTPGVNHTISAVFTDSNDVFITANPTPNPIIQTVDQGEVLINLSSSPAVSPTTPVYGQAVDIIATITPKDIPNVAGASNPTGNVLFIVDGNPALTFYIPINPYAGPPASQTATLTLPGNLLLSPGAHVVTAAYVGTPNAYVGDGNYAPSATPISFNLTIQPDSTTVTFPTQPTSSNLGQTATFQAKVNTGIPGSTGVPTGFINFYDGSTSNPPLNSSPIAYSGGTVSFSISSLLLGAHTIIAKFTPTNANYTGSQASYAFNVLAATTSTSIINVAPATPTYGQQVVFTMQVVPNPTIAPAFGLPTGTIVLRDGSAVGPVLGTGNVNPANGQATVTTTAFGLTTGSHTLFAVYSGDGQFGTSSGTYALTVNQATTSVALTGNPATSATWQPSQPIVLTATVSASVGGVPTGAGSTVTFVDTTTGATLGTVNVGAGGVATLPSFQANTLSAGPHVFKATYTDAAANYATSFGTLNYSIVNAPTTVTSITPDIASGNAVFGQPIALTATITSPAGTVNFGIVTFVDTSNGNLVLGSAPVSGGSATLSNITTLTAASHNIKATYTNTANNYFLTSFNTLNGYIVNKADTNITSFTNTPSTSAFNQSVAFAVSVVSQSPSAAIVKEGTIRFTDVTGAPVILGTVAVTNGTATLNYSTLSLGTHTIQAQYLAAASNPNFLNSATTTVTQIVKKASTVSVSAISGAVFGQPLNYTVTVTGTPGTPTGTITLTEGATTLDTATLNGSGIAIISVPAGLNPGSHTLVFSYSGDSVPSFGFAPSSKTITQGIAAAGTTTTLSALSPVPFGTQVTFTATVDTKTPSLASDPITGSVTFKRGTTILATVNLSGSNVAMFTTTTPLTVGSHSITAVYNGSLPNYAASTSIARTQTVTAAGTTTALDPLSGVFFGQAVTFKATVTSSTGLIPVGTVNFKNGATVLSTKTLVNGVATFTTTPTQLKAGNHTITAVYTPANTNFTASTSAAETQAVAQATTATTLTSSSAGNTSIYGQAATFTAIVAATSPGTPGTPTGTVTFRDNGNLLATVTLVAGKATFKTSALIADPGHNITADYNPTTPPANFAAGSDSLTQTVNRADTTTNLTSNPIYWGVGQSVTFTAALTSVTGAVPNGTVTFTVDDAGGTIFTSTVNLVAGVAKLNNYVFPLATGTYTVAATYNPATVPNQNFNPNSAASSSQTQDVRKATTATLSGASNTNGVMLSSKITGAGGTPTGTVNFYEIVNGVQVLLGTGTVNASGVASYFATLASGGHTILAVYSGDTNFNPASVSGVIQGKVTGRLV